MDYEDQMAKLHSEFLADINKPLSERYYEEDELLDIFDYATDIDDIATRMEVLMLGQRLYPGSKALSERKAMLYWSIGDNAAAGRALAAVRGKSFMARLTDLRIRAVDQDVTSVDLDALIAHVKENSLPDEEVIQLIETAEETGLQQWLVDNYEKIKKIAIYPETVMYDLVAPVAEWCGEDFTFVNRMLDDLTMSSPYDVGYWEFAAQTALEKESDSKRALGYLEYALAINPDSVRSLLMKSRCFLSDECRDIPRAVKAAESAFKQACEDAEAVSVLASALAAAGKKERAEEVISEYLDKAGKPELSVFEMLTSFDCEADIDEKLNKVIARMPEPERRIQLDKLLNAYVNTGNFEHASAVMEIILKSGYGKYYSGSFMTELFFRTEKTDNIVDVLNSAHPFDNRTWLLALVLSMPPVDKDGILEAIDTRLKLIDAIIDNGMLSDVLEARAIKAYALKIRETIESDNFSGDLDDLSPFKIGLKTD